MELGVSLATFAAAPTTTNVVDAAVALARRAADAGFGAVWFGQMSSYDAIGLAALVGREVPGVKVGPSVVPMFPRHPEILAAAAKTAQAATGGRFRLGIGLGAGAMQERAYGQPYPPPIKYLREYLTALRPLLAGDNTEFEGDLVVSRPFMPTAVAGAEADIPIIVAAMGPQALRVSGELADGILPYLAGPRALGEHIVPALTAAANAAGRPTPRVITGIPAVVTNDVERVRAKALEQGAFYERVPSYRKVLDLEGAERAGELFVIGDEETVAKELRRYIDAGATEITLSQTDIAGAEDQLRTWRFAGELARELRG
jgi:F420-dependent oxidoreductase-like protein